MEFPFIVIIKGAGDIASGIAHRLWQAGFRIVMLELPQPLVVRTTVSFAVAVYQGSTEVEGITGCLAHEVSEIEHLWKKGVIPVFVDPTGKLVHSIKPYVLVDAIMAKRNIGTTRNDAPIVIRLGPGFVAPQDVHAVIETQRGHDLGRVIYYGSATVNTGIPGNIMGYSIQRVLRAPTTGKFKPLKQIGDIVKEGNIVAAVDDFPAFAVISGIIRGLLLPGLTVEKGMKIGDIDPRGKEINYFTISDKARAVGGVY